VEKCSPGSRLDAAVALDVLRVCGKIVASGVMNYPTDYPYKRECIFCKRVLTHCNGFCLARDILKILKGEKDVKVREICGRCIAVVSLITDPDYLYP